MHSIFLIAIGVLTITAAITCRNVETDADAAAALIDVAATTSSTLTTPPTVAKIPAPRVRSRQSKEMKFDKIDNLRHDEPKIAAVTTPQPLALSDEEIADNGEDKVEDFDDVGSSPWTMLLEDWVVR